jgi:hypothetical protein
MVEEWRNLRRRKAARVRLAHHVGVNKSEQGRNSDSHTVAPRRVLVESTVQRSTVQEVTLTYSMPL